MQSHYHNSNKKDMFPQIYKKTLDKREKQTKKRKSRTNQSLVAIFVHLL